MRTQGLRSGVGCHSISLPHSSCDRKVGKSVHWAKIRRGEAPLPRETCSHRIGLLYEQRMDSGDLLPRFEFWVCHLLSQWPWAVC